MGNMCTVDTLNPTVYAHDTSREAGKHLLLSKILHQGAGLGESPPSSSWAETHWSTCTVQVCVNEYAHSYCVYTHIPLLNNASLST